MKTPYFVFQPKKLQENYSQFNKACSKYLKSWKICYSVKTNSYPNLLSALSKLNSGFELASEKEIKLTKKYNNFKIMNGPAKTKQELKSAINNNILIIADSLSELKKITKLTKQKKLEIGLRISIEESKFGISIDKLKETIEFANKNNLPIICLQLHQGTQLNFPDYKTKLRTFSDIISRLNLNLKYIDVGGGFPDKYQLKNLNLKLDNYIEIIAHYFNKFNSTIILEPGRSLVSNSFYLVTKVIAIKQSTRNYAILDAGINLLPKITLSKYKFSKIEMTKKKQKNKQIEYMLAGPLLFANDILGKYYGNLKENDLIKVENVGAYCYNLAWEISYKKPKIITENQITSKSKT